MCEEGGYLKAPDGRHEVLSDGRDCAWAPRGLEPQAQGDRTQKDTGPTSLGAQWPVDKWLTLPHFRFFHEDYSLTSFC